MKAAKREGFVAAAAVVVAFGLELRYRNIIRQLKQRQSETAADNSAGTIFLSPIHSRRTYRTRHCGVGSGYTI